MVVSKRPGTVSVAFLGDVECFFERDEVESRGRSANVVLLSILG